MAGQPSIVVRFAANVRDFIAGSGQVERALDDLSTESADLARDTERMSDRMGRAFDEMARDARTAERKLDKAFDGIERSGRDAAADTGREVGGEFMQNVGEGVGSGAVDLKDAVLGTFGGLATLPVIGPAVLLGGTFVAAIWGTIEKERERMKAAGVAAFDAFTDGVLEQAERDTILQESLGVDNLSDAVDQVTQMAQDLGVPFRDLYRYLQGEQPTMALARGLREANVQTDALRGRVRDTYENAGPLETAFMNVEAAARRTRDATVKGADAAERYRDAVKGTPVLTVRYSPLVIGRRPGGGRRDGNIPIG